MALVVHGVDWLVNIVYPITTLVPCQIGFVASTVTGEMLRLGCGRWLCTACGPRNERQCSSAREPGYPGMTILDSGFGKLDSFTVGVADFEAMDLSAVSRM